MPRSKVDESSEKVKGSRWIIIFASNLPGVSASDNFLTEAGRSVNLFSKTGAKTKIGKKWLFNWIFGRQITKGVVINLFCYIVALIKFSLLPSKAEK